ncbi:MAG: AAA family ATPase [Methanosarcinales archaeon]|nr:AAA family ATPase [Methanosarcinales archaeon]
MSINNLSAWFKKRPKWLQRTARELLEKGHLDDKDVIDLAELCLKEVVGAAEDLEYTISSDVFRADTIDSLHLCSIGDVQNINALAPKNPLNFGKSNLVVVYGQNGSGKSGYVRILKHACWARYPETLHSNIYSSEQSPQQCSISYEKGGLVKQFQWQTNSGIIEDLCSIDIFDALCGQVYIANENEVTYEPPMLLFFSGLIAVCGKMSKIMDGKSAKLVSKKPVVPSDYASTVSGRWYSELSKDITADDIAKRCTWKGEDDKELEDLEKRLSEQAPADKAKQLRTQKQYVDNLIYNTEDFLKKLSDENCRRILAAKKNSLLKQNAAKAAAEQVFVDAPLEGVGSDVWKLLWEQARKYSQEQAYKDIAFPSTEEAARCVLCQQPLSNEARERIQSFEEFVKGKMQKEAKAAKKVFNDAIEGVGELPSVENVRTKADAAGIDQTEDFSVLEKTYTALRNRKNQLLKVDSVEDMDALPQIKEWIDEARSRSSGYDESAQKYEEDAKKDNRADLVSIQLELQARKWLSQQRKSVEDEISRLEQVDVLQAAKNLTDTTILSRKKGDLAEKLITEAFVKRFDGELKQLGANRIKIELAKTRVKKGRVLHHLQLRDTSNGSPEDVLSEGEHRIVSLAAFLADVAEKQNSAPFVFDDPISSLDQDFEEAVVQRLVDLSKERQVIVFTHRLSLLGLIQEYGKKACCEPHVIYIQQESWGTGEPCETQLWAVNPKTANNILLDQRLREARNVYVNKGQQTYDIYAQSLCSEFRKLLEKSIEHDLLADVVQRYRRAVNTLGKIDKLARITDADCKFFDDMMTKYSRYEHSQPCEAPVALPAPDELQQDMESLKKWRIDFSTRNVQ